MKVLIFLCLLTIIVSSLNVNNKCKDILGVKFGRDGNRGKGKTKCLGNDKPYINRPYDYIVVGGGASGSLVAFQLAEDFEGDAPNVLVLEKGFDETENAYTFPHPDPNNLFSQSPSTAHLPVDVYNTLENEQC